MHEFRIQPAGDAAFMVDVGDHIDLAVNRRVHAIVAAVRDALAPYAHIDVTPAYAALLVSFDPQLVDATVIETVLQHVFDIAIPPVACIRRFTLPTCYGGTHGPDLREVAQLHHLSEEEVIARHAGRDYPIFSLGFSPGFPFLGNLDPALSTPRLETPRRRVPAGSVAIGGDQTGVYPSETPGGWRLIGRTPLVLFDVTRIPPVPYGPGDVIQFEPILEDEYSRLLASPSMPTGLKIRQ